MMVFSLERIVMDSQEQRIIELEAEVASLRKALEPFASFADHMVNDEGWVDREHRASISTWFGPSDFRNAKEAVDKF